MVDGNQITTLIRLFVENNLTQTTALSFSILKKTKFKELFNMF